MGLVDSEYLGRKKTEGGSAFPLILDHQSMLIARRLSLLLLESLAYTGASSTIEEPSTTDLEHQWYIQHKKTNQKIR